ncbi:BTAD domain-containing putative transcriptional regulator [Nonomuraea sp. NPDC026600]|uniref:AfsR/SARP family transcriptional regulator n=1 Tax=Nonomuraea sp. NPDC026600 TaxID=3155363 RepID=UPI0033D9F24D
MPGNAPLLDVHVLGPVVLLVSGTPVAVDRPLERALLVRLALAGGIAVPDERLAADLWGDAAPARPAKRLRVLASRLRAALTPGSRTAAAAVRLGSAGPDPDRASERSSGPLVRTPGGYALAARAADLDQARAAAGRLHSAARTGDQATARAAAAEALALWRGPALGDLRPFPFAGAEGERLDAWRLELLVERLTADLELGRAAEVGEELERLAAEHPLHERLYCLLAVSLYRTGRQADALDRLAALRRTLADELGVDPSPHTAETELRLLRQDPSLLHRDTPAPFTTAPPEAGDGGGVGSGVPALPGLGLGAEAEESAWLPAPATSFVGRDSELAELVARLRRPGLVTLTGGPGSGKSRLALEVARALATSRSRSAAVETPGSAMEPLVRKVTLVELAPLRREGAVAVAVADAVGVVSDGVDPVPDCAAELEGTLLVLDNAEHLIDQVAALVVALFRRTTALTVLVTSQRPLLTAAEEVHRVGPLSPAAAAGLFRQRCAADQAGVDGEAVAAICAAVDRLPLGIELAAGLTRALTVSQLAGRVNDRLRLLVGGGRDRGPRHTSLRAALDWSHDLLGERERVVLRRLAVFNGGFDLEAAEQVVPDDRLTAIATADHATRTAAGTHPTETSASGERVAGVGGSIGLEARRLAPDDVAEVECGDVAPAVAELVDRSLVSVEADGERRRFGLLETVRDYARDRLKISGDGDAVQSAHLAWCLDLVRKAGEPDDFATAEAVAAVFAEWPNLLDALERAPGTARAADGLRLALALHTPWLIRGWYGEARRHFSALADAPGSTAQERLVALSYHGFVTTMVGRFDEAAGLLTKAAELAGSVGEDALTMTVLYYRGIVEIERGRLRDAFAPLFEGQRLAVTLAHTQRQSAFADALGTLYLYTGDPESALDRYVAALAFDRAAGDEHGLARGLSNQGQALLAMGRTSEAVARADESDHYAGRLDDRQILPLNQQIRAGAALASGDLAGAESHLRAAVAYAVTDGTGASMAHIDLADVLVMAGRLEEAGALLDAVYTEAPEHSTPWLAARAVSVALACASGRDRSGVSTSDGDHSGVSTSDGDHSGVSTSDGSPSGAGPRLAEEVAAEYAVSGFGWPRYAGRLAEVRRRLPAP